VELHRHQGDPILLLVVGIADLHFALDAAHVQGVHRYVWVSPLPGAPEVVEGMIDVQGTVIAVIDLARRLVGRAQAADPGHRLVVVRTSSRLLALHVDADVELASLDADLVRRAEALEVPGTTGIATLPDGLALVQDLEAVLSFEDGQAVDRALRAQAGTRAMAP
jgi:purine-binding chemotaxis protein CheW